MAAYLNRVVGSDFGGCSMNQPYAMANRVNFDRGFVCGRRKDVEETKSYRQLDPHPHLLIRYIRDTAGTLRINNPQTRRTIATLARSTSKGARSTHPPAFHPH
ncbi:hypothetical protein PIIN_09126 [Serendipita indica DSM 11827]|uniref:Uncharacterized protein n=1 Tax=Serendipita indica (strain DSM 11827) TaxID=1109443 RepID=G4TUZ9_SERID|nr:hypothetical protein PIIN_09126 [Serendipita indica DSM 11827]